MQSRATTVDEYLASLPEERRAAISAVRDEILRSLDGEYAEGMQYGMIGYYVPHTVFPPGYHADSNQPLPFACLASQKNHMALYLMSVVDESSEGGRFREAWAKTGKKLDMGKSCIRFKRVEDLALDVIGDAIRRMPARAWVEYYLKATVGRMPVPREEIRAAAAKRKAAVSAGAAKRSIGRKTAAVKTSAGSGKKIAATAARAVSRESAAKRGARLK